MGGDCHENLIDTLINMVKNRIGERLWKNNNDILKIMMTTTDLYDLGADSESIKDMLIPELKTRYPYFIELILNKNENNTSKKIAFLFRFIGKTDN